MFSGQQFLFEKELKPLALEDLRSKPEKYEIGNSLETSMHKEFDKMLEHPICKTQANQN